MKTVCIIGHFGREKLLFDGQTVKTRILTETLETALGQSALVKMDTAGGVKTLLKAPFLALCALARARNVVMLPAHNGLRVFGRLLPFFRPLFSGRRLHYVVIGGWLPALLQGKKGLSRALRRFDGIYVETSTMKKALEAQGFTNVIVLPNCKNLQILKEEELICPTAEPYRLCTFSRVNEKKGIGDAVAAVRAVNESFGRTVYTLDIYGAIDAGQGEWFASLQKTFPDCVRYGGAIPYDQSVETLRGCFALLFPTKYYTEGIPGTIVDAYAAGVPVVSARWESFADVVEEGKTGVGYEFGNADALAKQLFALASDPAAFNAMKPNCLQKAQEYTPFAAMEVLSRKIN